MLILSGTCGVGAVLLVRGAAVAPAHWPWLRSPPPSSHAMLLSGTHSKADAFLMWAWTIFDRDHAATVEASTVPRRIAWGDDDQDVPHISLDRPQPADTPAAT